jgi:hypothetical protein
LAAAPPGNESADAESIPIQDSTAWRQELADKLVRYHSRRRPRPPRYPSLRLRFEHQDHGIAPDCSLDEFQSSVRASNASPCEALESEHGGEPIRSQQQANLPLFSEVIPLQPTAKIIEFPRSSVAPPVPIDELAEPVFDRPRILEAPALTPPPPALGGITIEGPEKRAIEKRPGIDIPLQSAALMRRIVAAGCDALLVAIACGLFGFIFWKIAAVRPPALEAAGLALGLAGVFWAGSQYLLIVYSGATLGLRLARLELARFDGSPASRRLRRWRVLASFLSAASLGMGYLWVFLDEDALCWHDRITHTYLAPKPRKRGE